MTDPTDRSPSAALLDPLLDATHKAFPLAQAPLRRSQVGAQGWNVLAGDLPLPVAVIHRSALAHNLGWMQRFADDAGVGFAPHGKTTMSPQLLARQLHAGAWGLTFATVGQARVGAAAGARRIVIANQVLQAADLHGLDVLRREFAGLRVVFLLDSAAQLEAIEGVARAAGAAPFEVLVELGLAGGRTGCRTHDEAIALARRAHASAAVALVGIECYEGPASSGDDAEDGARVSALMDRVDAVARQCDGEALFDADEVIVTAGGSAVFDLVVPRLRPALRRPVTGLLRSGCYLTHDHGSYRRLVGAVNRRIGCAEAAGLQGALEVWAVVQSRPEPDLAILAAGKRDVSFDMGLPMPVRWCAAGGRVPLTAPPGWTITGLNDQHAYLRREGGDAPWALRVGDRVALGISHPCTTFDKWRWMPVVDDAYDVVDAVTTCF
jgi:D-serine dehydratase